MAHDLSDFQTDIIDQSQRTPVLVDFWAAWCGPCKMLGPVLEKLAGEAAGRWMLVKIDTDAHQDLAAQFGIRGIPNVKLFHHGEVIAEFAGALPEPQLRAWLNEHLPTPKREGMARARELLRAGRGAEAAAALQPLAAAEPQDAELAVLLARATMFDHPKQAAARVSHLPAGHAWTDDAEIVRAITAALHTLQHDSDRLLASPLRDIYLVALRDLQSQRFREAAQGLVSVLQEKPNYDDGRAKAACLAVFKHLGMRHPITEEFSRAYSMAVNV
ncbi:thioredoxin [Opitutus terrae]|uniref:Thioredoxin n=1 Tax=Opitutus terrae (strain DSM 11246 / JCM 15787 / PB90-1) TaxID=452637 RepID=B1ZSN7_OPITP|nr:thioredoxin [Opitutus terrae]ACB74736.1 thioredoxin [Opitutus terrae PB90-1]